MSRYILTLAFAFLAFSFVGGQVARVSISHEVAFILLDLVLGGVILGLAMYTLIKRREVYKEISKNPLVRPLILFFVVCFISLLSNSTQLSSNQFLVAALYLVRLGFYYSLLLVIPFFSVRNKEKIQLYMLFVGGVIVLFGYIQLFIYPDMRPLMYLGWDDHYYRMVSTFLDPNFVGIFYVLYFLFLLDFGIKMFKTLSTKVKIGLSFMILVTFLAIFLTYSRTALLALLISLGVYLFVAKQLRFLLGIIVVSLLLILVLANTQYESLNPLRTASINARILAGGNALTLIQDNPILGVGFNAYRYALERKELISMGKYPNHGEAGTDNSLLFITATTGLVGLFSFLYLWGQIVKNTFGSKVGLSSIAALFVGGMFINALFYTFLLFWIFLLLSITRNNSH